jgi:hypothetical protein
VIIINLTFRTVVAQTATRIGCSLSPFEDDRLP